MREKFVMTPQDEKYMKSIGKNYKNSTRHKSMTPKKNPFADSWRVKNEKLHPSAKGKALVVKMGQGKSHITGNIYNH